MINCSARTFTPGSRNSFWGRNVRIGIDAAPKATIRAPWIPTSSPRVAGQPAGRRGQGEGGGRPVPPPRQEAVGAVHPLPAKPGHDGGGRGGCHAGGGGVTGVTEQCPAPNPDRRPARPQPLRDGGHPEYGPGERQAPEKELPARAAPPAGEEPGQADQPPATPRPAHAPD